MTSEKPLTLRRGEDSTISGTVTDETGAAVDISAGSIAFNVKDALADADTDIVITKSGTALDASGNFTITLAAADTSALSLKGRYYDIELTLGGNKSTVTFGKFILRPEVTRA